MQSIFTGRAEGNEQTAGVVLTLAMRQDDPESRVPDATTGRPGAPSSDTSPRQPADAPLIVEEGRGPAIGAATAGENASRPADDNRTMRSAAFMTVTD